MLFWLVEWNEQDRNVQAFPMNSFETGVSCELKAKSSLFVAQPTTDTASVLFVQQKLKSKMLASAARSGRNVQHFSATLKSTSAPALKPTTSNFMRVNMTKSARQYHTSRVSRDGGHRKCCSCSPDTLSFLSSSAVFAFTRNLFV